MLKEAGAAMVAVAVVARARYLKPRPVVATPLACTSVARRERACCALGNHALAQQAVAHADATGTCPAAEIGTIPGMSNDVPSTIRAGAIGPASLPPRRAAGAGRFVPAAADRADRRLGDQHHQELSLGAGHRLGAAGAGLAVGGRPRGPAAAIAHGQDGDGRRPHLPPTRQRHVHPRRRLRGCAATVGGIAAGHTGEGFYRRYVDLTYLRPYYTVPFFLAVFILLLYFLGKFMAAGIGRFFTSVFERFVSRVPGVRAVYSSIKQVTDFLFSRQNVRFTRIVAVEFPRRGIWSMGFVTNEHFTAISDAAGEPIFTVLIPYSPIPHSGCTISVRRSECIELDVTFDQACQFIFSCGVVTPPEQLPHRGKWRDG